LTLCLDLIVIDDLALRSFDVMETSDLYELITKRHRKGSLMITSNRTPDEWLPMLTDPMLAQALVDRFVNNAWELVIEGESYRRHQKPQLS
jgi:DNA replication protein DnaC